jgi:hypothetical protein
VKRTKNVTIIETRILFTHPLMIGISLNTILKLSKKKELGKRVIGEEVISAFVINEESSIHINGKTKKRAPIERRICRITLL